MHTNLFLNADIFSQAGRFKWIKIKYKTTQLQCEGLVASDLLTLQKSCADLYMHLWTNERIFAMDVFVTACSECNDWHIILQRFWISLLIRQSPWQMSVTYIINICFSWYVRMIQLLKLFSIGHRKVFNDLYMQTND